MNYEKSEYFDIKTVENPCATLASKDDILNGLASLEIA